MKKRNYGRKVLVVFVVAIFFVAFLETILYYRDDIANRWYLLFLSIMNGIRIFGIDSSIEVFDVLQVNADNISLARSILNHLYILSYFGAPLIVAQCIVRVTSFLAKEKFVNLGALSKKKRIVIVGFNENVEKLIRDIISSKKEKQSKLLILHKEDILTDKKFEFQMSGVIFKKYEKLDYEKTEFRKAILRWMSPQKVKHIILFEEKEMDNVSNYCFFLRCFEEKGHSGFFASSDEGEKLKIDCNYNLPQVEELIWDCYDKSDIGCEYYSMNTFSLSMLRAQSVLQKYKIYDNVIEDNGECRDVHLLIVGFGRMGKRFLKRAINQSVVSEKNSIVVDIIEKDLEKTKWYFEKMCQGYYNDGEGTVHIDLDVVEGNLKIRIHELDINDSKFAEYLENISKEVPFTYVAICIDSSEESIECMLCVENYLREREQTTPVLVRMDSGQQLKGLEKVYDNLKLVPGDDEIISLENIRSDKNEEDDKNIHKKDDKKEKDRTKLAYQIESRKYRVLHYETKKELVNKLSNLDKECIREKFKFLDDKKAFLSEIRENEVLWRLGAIEHRRWSYYMILNGWIYGEEKNIAKKETPNLCPFAKILSNSKLEKDACCDYKDWQAILLGDSDGGKGE